MIAGIGWAVMLVGALWMLLAAIGIHRMGSTLSRLLVAGKAATMGIGAVLVGAAVVLQDPAGSGLLVLSALVLVVTTPAGAHALARSVRGVSPVALSDDDEPAPAADRSG
ncbi:cation:proton antiporter [Euzebya rosea]|uniref:cation:proton antiporter n=1 Tax=Euzebya rosea TaxID=2052804 RepID=UPI000D3E0B99|nr:monovalent cation/H(+) antiporter subunit G [Euzebya rosea]